jgi:hypothetical protein
MDTVVGPSLRCPIHFAPACTCTDRPALRFSFLKRCFSRCQCLSQRKKHSACPMLILLDAVAGSYSESSWQRSLNCFSFVDEPTSRPDSSSWLPCGAGRPVPVRVPPLSATPTTHQPSSEFFQTPDRFILLRKGDILYVYVILVIMCLVIPSTMEPSNMWMDRIRECLSVA